MLNSERRVSDAHLEIAAALACLGDATVRGSATMNDDKSVPDANPVEPGSEPIKSNENASKATVSPGPKRFPEQLMTVLDLGDYEDFGISWLQHGYSFVISNPQKFSSKVLSKNFPQKTMTNFIRELSRWGFTATDGGEMNTFYHKFFQRNNYRLCQKMRPQKKTFNESGICDATVEPLVCKSNRKTGVSEFSNTDKLDLETAKLQALHDTNKDLLLSSLLSSRHLSPFMLSDLGNAFNSSLSKYCQFPKLIDQSHVMLPHNTSHLLPSSTLQRIHALRIIKEAMDVLHKAP